MSPPTMLGTITRRENRHPAIALENPFFGGFGRDAERNRGQDRARTHCGDVAQVGCHRAMADRPRGVAPERKCTPSISASVVMTDKCEREGRQAAASSPIPRVTRRAPRIHFRRSCEAPRPARLRSAGGHRGAGLSERAQRAQFGGGILRAENARTHHDVIDAGRDDRGDVFASDAAVDLELDRAGLWRSISARASRTFLSAFGMKVWPLKPGLTLMIRINRARR